MASERFFLAHAVVLVFLALAAGCSIQLTEQAPAVSPSEETWLVHCETAASHRPSDTAVNNGVSKPQWLVALDSSGVPIRLRGRLEDGFLILTEGQPTEDALRLGCIAAVEASAKPDDNEVARILAFREQERVNVAIAFAAVADESQVQRLIVFGDSLSDTGVMKSRVAILDWAIFKWPDVA